MFVRRQVELIGSGTLLPVVLGLAVLFFPHHCDRSYIIYRYAFNLANGFGLLYNPGQAPILSEAVAPLYALVLGICALFFSNLPALSNVLSVIAIATGGLMLYGLAQPAGKVTAMLAAGAYMTFPLLWITLGLETTTWMALCLGAIWLHQHQRGAGVAALLALATLMRLEAGILAVILLSDSLASGRSFHFLPVCIYVGSITLGGLWALAAYQPGGQLLGLPPVQMAAILPDSIGKDVWAGMAALGRVFLSPIWLWPALTCAWGLTRLKEQRWAILLIGWGIFHILSLAVLKASVYAWSFVPLLPALAALSGMGIEDVSSHVRAHRHIAAGVAIALYIIPVLFLDYRIATPTSEQNLAWQTLSPAPVDDRYVQAGHWLHDHTPVDAQIGATHIGVLGYLSHRQLLDYHGSIQPDIAEALVRGDSQWWLASTEPEYVVITATEFSSLGDYSFEQDTWFASRYTEITHFIDPANESDPLLVFQRTSSPTSLSELLINYVVYPNGLTVNGIAADFSLFPLASGCKGLVKLEWLVNQVVDEPQHIVIRIQARGEGAVAGLSNRVMDFSAWPQRRLITTYHPIEIAAGLPPGVYDIQIGIGPGAFDLDWQTVGQAKVPFQGADLLGGISGAKTEFGDIALLGYRLARTEHGLELLLLWEAIHRPQADYRVFVQVRDPMGIIITQDEFEPHEGSYPTSIWSAGEQVPDVYILDISDVPSGSYQVYIGLLNPDNTRIITLDDQDALFVGQVDVNP